MPIFRNYVLAGQPLLWIDTFEEYRAMITFYAEMQQAKIDIPYKFYSWDCADGMKKFAVNNGIPSWTEVAFEGDTCDPLVALGWFGQKKLDNESAENSILFLKDLHRCIDKDQVVRKIRNLIPMLKASGRVLAIISPILHIPSEIEKEVIVINFSLPDRDELRRVLKGVCESANQSGNITYPVSDEELIDASLGMTSSEAEGAFSISLIEKKLFDPAVVRREKAAIVKKTGLLEVLENGYGLESIGGLENVKEWLLARKNCFKADARSYGITPPKGLLLIGVPGTGKTLIAKAVAHIWSRPILRLDVGKVMGKYVGESEDNLGRCLNISEAIAPCVLMIDEFEKSFAGAKGDGDSSGVTKRIFGNFLTWVQEHTSDVFIVATANEVQSIPAAMLRCGRFDVIFWVDLPGFNQRKEIIGIHLSKVKRDPSKYDLNELSKISEGRTGAEIEGWVKEALIRSYAKKSLEMDDLRQTINSITSINTFMKEEIQLSRDWALKRGTKNASKEDSEKQPETVSSRKLNMGSAG